MKNQVSIIYRALIGCILAIMFAGCSDHPSGDSLVTPEVLRLAPLPDQSPEILQRLYKPVLDYLKKETGLPTRLVIADSYAHLLELFESGQVDIANFGGVTYVTAHKNNNAEALVLRDIDGLFSSVVLVRAEASEKDIQELKGKSFGFGSKLSTSGHLMPRHFFGKAGIQPETFFASIEFSGAHDKTAYWVRDKKVYAGVANSGVVDQMYKDGRLKTSEVRVLWESPTYPDYVWAVQTNMPASLKKSIQRAFLALQASNAEDKIILDNLGAGYYLSANHSDFVVLERILEDLTARGTLQ